MNTTRILTSTLAAAALLGTSLFADNAPEPEQLQLLEISTVNQNTGEVQRYLEIDGYAKYHPGFLFLIAGRERMAVPAVIGPHIEVLPEIVLPLGQMTDAVRLLIPAQLDGHVYVQAVYLYADSRGLATSNVHDIGTAASQGDQDDGSAHDGDGVSDNDGSPPAGSDDGIARDDGRDSNSDADDSQAGQAGETRKAEGSDS